LAELELPPDRSDTRHAWHLYILRLNLDLLDIDRKEFIAQLGAQGVGTSVHFIPIPLHPHFASLDMDRCGSRRALELYPRIVSLPLYPAMTEEQVYYVVEWVKNLVAAHRVSRQVCFSEVG
jgi:dTDP-4-amino-4,6-dideoxygalactose transaminase